MGYELCRDLHPLYNTPANWLRGILPCSIWQG
jgi:hypothetical protein